MLDSMTYAGRTSPRWTRCDDVDVVEGGVRPARSTSPGGRGRPRRSLRRRLAQRQLPRRPVAVHRHQHDGHLPGLIEAVRRHDKRLHHISTDEVYGDLGLDDPAKFSEDNPGQPLQPLLGVQGQRRPPVSRVDPVPHGSRRPSRTAPTTTARASTSRSSSPAGHRTSSRASGPSSTAAAPTCATGSTSTTTTTRSWTIIEQGRMGETYLIGADGEVSNRDVVRSSSELGRGPDCVRPRDRPCGARPALRHRRVPASS